MCDVIWDKPFIGGSPMDGLVPDRRGYRIPHYSLLNLGKYKKMKEQQKPPDTKVEPKQKTTTTTDDHNGDQKPVFNHGSSPQPNQRNQKMQIKQR